MLRQDGEGDAAAAAAAGSSGGGDSSGGCDDDDCHSVCVCSQQPDARHQPRDREVAVGGANGPTFLLHFHVMSVPFL